MTLKRRLNSLESKLKHPEEELTEYEIEMAKFFYGDDVDLEQYRLQKMRSQGKKLEDFL